jgi:O-antigen/teichoic acid export membrane protein
MTVWPQTVAYLATLGIPAAVVFHVRSSPREGRQILTAAILLSCLLGAAAALAGVFGAPLFISHYGVAVLHATQVFVLLAPAGLVGLVVIGTLQARLEFRLANGLVLAPAVLTLLLLLVLLRSRTLTPTTAALAVVIPSLLVCLAAVRYLFDIYGGFELSGVRNWFKHLFSYGLWAYPLDLIGTFAASIDQAVVIGLVGPVSLGWYVVALRGSRVVNMIQQAVAPVLFARAAGRSKAEVVAITGRSGRMTLLMAAVCGAVLAWAAGPLLVLIYGKAFLPAVTIFRLLLLEAVLSGVARIVGQAFFALGRPGTVAVLQGAGLASLIALLLVLVPRFGILGAALALICSTAARLLSLLVAYPLILQVRPPSFIFRWSDLAWVSEALKFRTAQ